MARPQPTGVEFVQVECDKLARWTAAIALPTAAGGFPWTTLAVNVLGCFLIGVLVALVTDVVTAHPLVRPSSAPACWAASRRSPATRWTARS